MQKALVTWPYNIRWARDSIVIRSAHDSCCTEPLESEKRQWCDIRGVKGYGESLKSSVLGSQEYRLDIQNAHVFNVRSKESHETERSSTSTWWPQLVRCSRKLMCCWLRKTSVWSISWIFINQKHAEYRRRNITITFTLFPLHRIGCMSTDITVSLSRTLHECTNRLLLRQCRMPRERGRNGAVGYKFRWYNYRVSISSDIRIMLIEIYLYDDRKKSLQFTTHQVNRADAIGREFYLPST